MCALCAAGLLNAGRVIAMADSGFNVMPSSFGPFTATRINWQDPYDDPKAEVVISRTSVRSDRVPIEMFFSYKGRQYGADRLISPKLIFQSTGISPG